MFYDRGLEEQILLKCQCYPGQSTHSNASPVKIPSTYFTELEQIILKFVWNQRSPQVAKGMLKKPKAGGITILDFTKL